MGVLIKCATCGDKVSSAAKACPHCGEPEFHGDALADYRVDAIALQHGNLSTHAMGHREPSSPEELAHEVSNNGRTNGLNHQFSDATGDAASNAFNNGAPSTGAPPSNGIGTLTEAPSNQADSPSPPVTASSKPRNRSKTDEPPDTDSSTDSSDNARSPHDSFAAQPGDTTNDGDATEDTVTVPTAPQPVAAQPAPAVPSIPMLVYWASLGQFDSIQQNIAQFPDVNASDGSGYTALHAAAEYGYAEITQFLLDNGANCSVRYTPTGHTSAYAGFTPLMLAEKSGHRAVAELIRTKMEAEQAQRLAAAPRPRVQHSPIVKQAIADVAASARQSQPRVVGHNHALGAKHLDVTYVFSNRGDLQIARRNGKCEWLQFETRAALKKRGFPLQIYPTINVWFKDKTSFYMNENRNDLR